MGPGARSLLRGVVTSPGPALLLITWTACVDVDVAVPTRAAFEPRSLEPVRDYHEEDYVRRMRPKHIELAADERLAFVALEGTEIHPESRVLALDAGTGDVVATLEVGASPQGMALSPAGDFVYVANQYSNHLTVIDAAELTVVGRIPATYYAQDIAVSPDGRTLYVTNRWLDAVELIELDESGRSGRVAAAVAVPVNPRDVVVGPGGLLYVGSLGGTSIGVVDPVAREQLPSIHLNAPVNGLASDGSHLFVATLGRGDGHSADGALSAAHQASYRGDGTASVGFADVNNDVAVVGIVGGSPSVVHRYTSDTAEVSLVDARGDYGPGEMIIAGALPEQAVVRGGRLFVTMSASDSVQVFDVEAETGGLTPAAVLETGINPFELAVSADGTTVLTADRLGDTVSRIRVVDGQRVQWDLGAAGAAFPASEYETAEMLFHSARFSSEALPSPVFPAGDMAGDKSCNHCHREALQDGKVWTVGIDTLVPVGGERMPPAARNLRDTMPLFWEGTQDQHDFDLEVNEFSPPVDFGCDGEMTEHDPESCAARDAFFLQQTGFTFRQVATDLLGKFLVGRPRLPPNPLAQDPTPEQAEAIERGAELFFSAEVGCGACHPMMQSDRSNPFTSNEIIPPVIPASAFDNGVQFKDEIDGHFNVPSLRGAWDRPVFFHDGRAKSLRAAILSTGHPALQPGRDGCHHLDQEQSDNRLVRVVLNGQGCNERTEGGETHGNTAHLTVEQVDDLVLFIRSLE